MENLQNFVSKSFTGDRIPTAIRKEHLSFSVDDLLSTPHEDDGFSSDEEDREDEDVSLAGKPRIYVNLFRLMELIAAQVHWQIF